MYIICICKNNDVFRINEKTPVSQPIFFGPNGSVFEKICDEVKSQILKEIEMMNKNRHVILDVTCVTWQDEMNRCDFFFLNTTTIFVIFYSNIV